jgi:hypothetical protein
MRRTYLFIVSLRKGWLTVSAPHNNFWTNWHFHQTLYILYVFGHYTFLYLVISYCQHFHHCSHANFSGKSDRVLKFCVVIDLQENVQLFVWNFHVTTDNFNMVGICTSRNCALKWITKFYNYSLLILARLSIQIRTFEEKCHKIFPELVVFTFHHYVVVSQLCIKSARLAVVSLSK